MLTLIERRRDERNDSTVASCVTWYIVDRELQELKTEILENPGAPQSGFGPAPRVNAAFRNSELLSQRAGSPHFSPRGETKCGQSSPKIVQ